MELIVKVSRVEYLKVMEGDPEMPRVGELEEKGCISCDGAIRCVESTTSLVRMECAKGCGTTMRVEIDGGPVDVS